MGCFRKLILRCARPQRGRGVYSRCHLFFAYNMPYAVVDGNVYRVLSRYLGIDTPIDSTEGKKLFALWRMNCWIERTPHYTIRLLWTSERSNVLLKLPTACFVHWLTVVRRWQGDSGGASGQAAQNKTTNRYFNYIYVRMGVHTFINKRTGNDIWRNLFELPLIETPVAVSEEEFWHCPSSRHCLPPRNFR